MVIVVSMCTCVNVVSVTVMKFIPPPHLILRKFFIAGDRITTFASHLATFCARTLFGTSGLALTGAELRTNIAYWSHNTGLCGLTEQVIFTDPYVTAPLNRWTTPQLDHYALAIKADSTLKLAVSALKRKFMTSTQALLHGDLHTGSVMCTEGSTFVIDPEFAFYGPMGFDLGAMLANLFLAYFSQYGHAARSNTDRSQFSEFILTQIILFYEEFEQKFLALWNDSLSTKGKVVGDLFPLQLLSEHSDCTTKAQKYFMAEIFLDSLGFCGAKMLRRMVGVAHVADMETIPDDEVRSVCEKRSLLFARELITYSHRRQHCSDDDRRPDLNSVQGLVQFARSVNAGEPGAWPAL
jgi:5-methylthioribose kinase